MAIPSAYIRQNDNRIMTASPAELVLMLYDGAIKFCNIAIVALENQNMEKAHNNIIKVQKIVDYLLRTLDMKYPVAAEFDKIYNYLLQRLIEANVKKDKEILEEVNMHLHSVRDTWQEVMRVNKEKGSV